MSTKMLQEVHEIPEKIAYQLKQNEPIWQEIKQRAQKSPIHFCMTVARGSSDHAATFAKYLMEVFLGLPTASSAPSIHTLYHSKLKLAHSLVLGLSQSGQSPDLCEVVQQARQSGALTIALVNQVDSPLANLAEYVVPLHAGEELSVAATKSYVATLSALVQATAILGNDQGLLDALDQLPAYLSEALSTNWQLVSAYLKNAQDILTIGRGFSYPIAQEAALKFKETCRLHAEAFSSAEVLHGPMALIKKDFPVLQFIQNDVTIPNNLELAQQLAALGSQMFIAAPKGCVRIPKGCNWLPMPKSLHGTLDPLVMITAFYVMVNKLALLKELNPDNPPNLKKVTETL